MSITRLRSAALMVPLMVCTCMALAGEPVPTHANITYATFGSQTLKLDVFIPTVGTPPYPVIVYIHGGGWFSGQRYPLSAGIEGVLDQGIAIVGISYRFTGDFQAYGGERKYPAQLHDCKGAVRWIRANAATYDLDPIRIGAWGSSAGAHLASLLATTNDNSELEGKVGGNLDQSSNVALAVDYFGPTDLLTEALDFTLTPSEDIDAPGSTRSILLDWFEAGQGVGDIRVNELNPDFPYPQLLDLAFDASPLRQVSSDDAPHFILHGDQDSFVALNQSTRLADALSDAAVPHEYLIVPGLNHNNPAPQYSAMAVAYAAAALAVDATPPGAPGNLIATPLSDRAIELTWDAADDAESRVAKYRIERDGSELATIRADATSYVDADLSPAVSYSYTVAAINHQFGESGAASAMTATLSDITPPAVLSAAAAGADNRIIITFNEALDGDSAETPGSYALSNGAAVLSATLLPGGASVELETSPLTPAQTYAVSAQSIADLALNTMIEAAVVDVTYSPRVTEGLLVLYDFDEGVGDIVHDVSNVEPAMHLKIANLANTTWSKDGLTIDSPTILETKWRATKVLDRVIASNELTVEAWITPANITQTGPARILTLSYSPNIRNLTLGQAATAFEIRHRTTSTDYNGIPAFGSGNGVAAAALTHVVCTRNSAGLERISVNGVEVASTTIAGDFSNWSSMLWLALANEQSLDRAWRGTFHMVSLYDRALSSEEVGFNFAAGHQLPDPPKITPCRADLAGDDATINVFDLLALLGAWGACGDPCPPACASDLVENCTVDLFDLLNLLAVWGACE